MRRLLSGILLTMAAGSVAAQTTDCERQVDGSVQCKTRANPTIQERQSDCEVGGMSALALGCTVGEIKRAKEIKAQREQIGALIVAGRCEEAKAIPLRAGDLDLAERVQKLCVAKP